VSYSSVVAADSPAIWYRFRDAPQTLYKSYGTQPFHGRNNPTGENTGWTGIATDGGSVGVNAGLSNQRALGLVPGTTEYGFEAWFWLVGTSAGTNLVVGNPFLKGTYGCGASSCGVQFEGITGPLWQGQGPTGLTVNGFTMPFNQWTYLAVSVIVGTSITFYQDGSMMGSLTESNTTPISPIIGITWLNALQFSPMFIAEVAAYPHALTSTMVGNHHAAPDTLSGPSPRPFAIAGVCT
jgi:hypothetical protein